MIGYDGKPVSTGGKGSKPRYADKKQYDKNYDAINWGRGKRAHKPTSSSLRYKKDYPQ
jgi:hypothetical protein